MILCLGDFRKGTKQRQFVSGILFIAVQNAFDKVKRTFSGFIETDKLDYAPPDSVPPKRVRYDLRLLDGEANPLEEQLKLCGRQLAEKASVLIPACRRIYVVPCRRDGNKKRAAWLENSTKRIDGVEEVVLGQVHENRRAEDPVELAITKMFEVRQLRLEEPSLRQDSVCLKRGPRCREDLLRCVHAISILPFAQQKREVSSYAASHVQDFAALSKHP